LLGQLRFVEFEWPLTVAFLAAAMVGMLGGLALASRFSSQVLRRAFAWVILTLGGFLLLKNCIG
jgi:uncharacterized membrane protein YfcA